MLNKRQYPTVLCNHCNVMVKIQPTRTVSMAGHETIQERAGQEIVQKVKMHFFECPHCGYKYTVMFSNASSRHAIEERDQLAFKIRGLRELGRTSKMPIANLIRPLQEDSDKLRDYIDAVDLQLRKIIYGELDGYNPDGSSYILNASDEVEYPELSTTNSSKEGKQGGDM